MLNYSVAELRFNTIGMGRNVSCSNHLKNIMFMKKIMMTLATLFVAVCASAQVYIGGGVGFANTSYDHDSKFSWKIAPEIGFQLDKKWDAGISLGYSGVEDKEKIFEVAPYVRYTACSAKIVDFFIEGTIGYEHHDLQHSSSDYDVWEVGLKPGLKVNLSNHVAFVTKIGFFGYQRVDEANTWGVNLDGRNILFGINYKF